MRNETAFVLFAMITTCIIFVLLFGGALWLAKVKCQKQWEHSGYETMWGPIQGCLVKTTDGRWVPASNVRALP